MLPLRHLDISADALKVLRYKVIFLCLRCVSSDITNNSNGRHSGKQQKMKQTVSSCRTVNRKRKLDRGDSTAVGDETQKPKKMTRSDLVISVNESLTSVDNLTPTNGTEKRSRKVRSDSGKTFTSDNAELHQGKEANGKQSKLAKNRKAYVIFVGNLPYHTSKEDIEKHFIRTGIDISPLAILFTFCAVLNCR